MSILALSTFLLPEPTASDVLSSYKNNTAAESYGRAVLLFFVVGATPFVASLGSVLIARGRGLVWAAMLLSILGMFSFALSSATLLGASYSLANTPSPSVVGMPDYEAALWWYVANNLNLLGIVAWGLGFLLFGLASLNSRILPNWLAVVGIIGGVSAFILIIPIVGFVLLPVAFGVWCFTVPFLVRRLPASATTGTSSPP